VNRVRVLVAGLAASIPMALAACTGRPVPSTIEGEPVCPDFEVGATHAKAEGSLRLPVQMTVREGSEVITRATVYGRRSEKGNKTRFVLTDDDATYQIEWAQCENERAPKPTEAGSPAKQAAGYECGNAKVYKTEDLVTKKGDAASRTLTFPAPPSPACWTAEAPPR
jgi:hypothetical protein